MTVIDQSPLHPGIAAARAGQRESARTLLLRALEQDERNAQAWLWLSGVMDTPEEQRICLENVLDIDANNQAAQQGLAWLNAHHPRQTPPHAASTGAATPEAPPVGDAAPAPADAPADGGPLPPIAHPCPSCGSSTDGTTSHCPRCRRPLVLRAALSPTRSVWLTIYSLVWGVVMVLAVGGVILGTLQPAHGLEGSAPRDSASALGAIVGGALTVVVPIYLFVGLRRRQRFAYITSVAVLGLLLLFSLAGGVAGLLVGGLPILLIGGVAAAAYRNVFPPKLRIETQVPPTTGDAHYNRGIAAKNQGMWYLAAREWEGAVATSPRDADYRRTLGLAYAQLGDYGRALRELRVAAELHPSDALIREDIALVERQVQRQKGGAAMPAQASAASL